MANRIREKRRRSRPSVQEEFAWDRPAVSHQRRGGRRHFVGWFVVLGFIGLALPIIWWIQVTAEERSMLELAEMRTDRYLAELVPEAPVSPEEKSKAAITALLGFVNDPSHQARANRIYETPDALEHLVAYYDLRKNPLPQRVINPAVSALNLHDRELLLVSFTDQDARQWAAPFEWKGDSYRLHWDAMVGFGEISWTEFFQNRPKGDFVMRANFFLPESDAVQPLAEDRIVILMTHPELAQAVSVEVRVGSEVHQQLMDFPRQKDIPAMVELYWPEGENRLPLVNRWLQRDWIER